MNEATQAAPQAAPETTAPPTTPLDRAIDALTKAPEPPAQPEAPAPEPPKAPDPPKAAPAAQPDAEAVAKLQARAHADAAAKIERERAALEARAKEIETQRAAVERAKRLEQLSRDDPRAFFRETGQDPVAFAKRLAEGERISEVARAELEGTSREVAELKRQLEELRATQTTQAQEATKAARASSLAEMRALSKDLPGAAHFLATQGDDPYLDALADEVRSERGFVTLRDVAERLDLRVREQLRTLLTTEWGREMAASVTKTATPAAPQGQRQTGAKAPNTLTSAVADERTAPPSDSPESRLSRAVDAILGGAARR